MNDFIRGSDGEGASERRETERDMGRVAAVFCLETRDSGSPLRQVAVAGSTPAGKTRRGRDED